MQSRSLEAIFNCGDYGNLTTLPRRSTLAYPTLADLITIV